MRAVFCTISTETRLVSRTAPSEQVSERAAKAPASLSSALCRPTSSRMATTPRAADRPVLTCGLQSGDVSADAAVVWARADRPARLLVEASTTDSFSNIVASTFVDALPESDLAGKVLLDDLPSDQDILYRVTAQDLASPTVLGEADDALWCTV